MLTSGPALRSQGQHGPAWRSTALGPSAERKAGEAAKPSTGSS